MEGLVKEALDPMFQYIGNGQLENSPAYRFGQGVKRKILPKFGPIARSLKTMDTPFGRSPGWANGMMVGGVGGAALGGLTGLLTGKGLLRGALTGGLAGAAGLGATGYALGGTDWLRKIPVLGGFAEDLDYHTTGGDVPTGLSGQRLGDHTYNTISEPGYDKSAAWGSGGGSQAYIVQKIFADSALAAAEKQQLANGVQQLSDAQAARLKQMVSAGFGAGIGAIVAKYLTGLGIVGILLSSVLGGVVGGAMGRTAQKPTHDNLGRPYFY